jgi:hypothetical protein
MEESMMKRPTLNYILCLVIAAVMFSACSGRRQQPAPIITNPAIGVAGSNATTTPASSLAASPSPGQASTNPANSSAAAKSGWWIRVNPGGTTAQSVTFQIGTSKLNREEWRVWRAGEPTEFDVPERYAQAPRLYVRGSVTPIGKPADLCLMYKNRGVEHMGFDDDDSETKSQTNVDFKCRF